MAQVTIADDDKKLRLMQVAVRLTDHFSCALEEHLDVDDTSTFAELCSRWKLLKGDLPLADFVEKLHSELGPLEDEKVFHSIRSRLGGQGYDYRERIGRLNELGYEAAKACIGKWGGKKSARRIRDLKPLPVRCETGGNEMTELYFERSARPKILVRPGNTSELLPECRLLEFSFFHEYISHAFPKWEADVDRLSEGWLLALEIEWFREEYTVLDHQSLLDYWLPKLGKDAEAYWVAASLLGRCEDKVCAKRYLLEWMADWDANDYDSNQDLVSLLTGAIRKTGQSSGSARNAKRATTRKVLDELLCGPCSEENWDIRSMRDALLIELERYDAPK